MPLSSLNLYYCSILGFGLGLEPLEPGLGFCLDVKAQDVGLGR